MWKLFLSNANMVCFEMFFQWQNHWPSQGATWLSVVDPNGTGNEICYKARAMVYHPRAIEDGWEIPWKWSCLFGEIMGKSSIKRGIVH